MFRCRISCLCGVVSFLAAALLASASATAPTVGRRGGTLRVVVSSDPGSIEPALVSSFAGFQMIGATQLGLVSFDDTGRGAGRRLVPSGAAAMPKISNGGKTYVFRIRRGLRFSDGSAVTARNFVAGFERVLDPRMGAISSHLFEEIKGARGFIARRAAGRAARVSGLVARNNRLVVHLNAPAPDFVEKLALPFVSALPLNLPVVPGGVDAPLPSAGPYYVRQYVRGRTVLLVRNPYWNRAALPWRPANVDAIEYLGRTPDEAAAIVSRGEADVTTVLGGSIAPDLVRQLIRRYGVNRGRFFVRPRLARGELIFNFRRQLFGSNAKLRRAVSFAIDRRRLARVHGPLAARPTDQLLLPGRPGFRDWKLFPTRPNLVTARRLAGGALRRRAVALYAPETPWGRAVAAVIRSDLARLGARVRVKTLATPLFVSRLTLPAEPWDLAVWVWGAPRVDPTGWINQPLDGRYVGRPPPYGFNWGGFDEVEWSARMRRVARLRQGRERAFARLDRDLMRRATPLVPYLVENALTVVSARVGCFSSLNSGWPNLVALCLR